MPRIKRILWLPWIFVAVESRTLHSIEGDAARGNVDSTVAAGSVRSYAYPQTCIIEANGFGRRGGHGGAALKLCPVEDL